MITLGHTEQINTEIPPLLLRAEYDVNAEDIEPVVTGDVQSQQTQPLVTEDMKVKFSQSRQSH